MRKIDHIADYKDLIQPTTVGCQAHQLIVTTKKTMEDRVRNFPIKVRNGKSNLIKRVITNFPSADVGGKKLLGPEDAELE